MSNSQTRSGLSPAEVPPTPEVPMMPAAAERHRLIGVAAYYRAERRGFAPGGAEADWLEAEADIDRLLAAMTRQGITRADYEHVGLRHALRLWSAS
jgi:hypothetical protein